MACCFAGASLNALPTPSAGPHTRPLSRPLVARWGTAGLLELTCRSAFLRAGRWEVFAAPDILRQSVWSILREPGLFEFEVGTYRLAASWAPVTSTAPEAA